MSHHKLDKAIVDYTSARAVHSRHPLPADICDAAYRQHAGGGHRQRAQKFGKDRARGSGDILADRQTDTQSGILIAVFRNRSCGRSNDEHWRCNPQH